MAQVRFSPTAPIFAKSGGTWILLPFFCFSSFPSSLASITEYFSFTRYSSGWVALFFSPFAAASRWLTTLADIGVTDVTEAKIRKVAEASCAAGETIHNEPFAVTPAIVYAAILAADALGKAYK